MSRREMPRGFDEGESSPADAAIEQSIADTVTWGRHDIVPVQFA